MAEAPKELSPEDIARIQAPAELSPAEVGRQVLAESAEAVGRRAFDAFTIGYADEIIAGAQAAFGADYGEALAESEAQTQRAQEEARAQSAFGIDPLDVAGLTVGGGALYGGLRALPVVRNLGSFSRSVIGGAGVGGAASAGMPGTLEERIASVPVGAGIGAAVGPLAAGAARVAGAGAGALRDIALRFTPAGQEQRALRQLGRSMERGDLTPETSMQELGRMGPQAVPADLPPLRRLSQQSVELEGPGRARAEALLESRNIEQGPRVGAFFREAMDEGRDFYTVADELTQNRRAQASPIYERIHQQSIEPTDTMRRILRRDAVRKAYPKARAIASNDDVELPTYDQLLAGEADITGVRTWDYIKRGLDDLAYSAREPGSGIGRTERQQIKDTTRDLLGELDPLVEGYADARALWAGPTRSLELMDAGREIYKNTDPEEFLRDIADLRPEELDYVRLGVVSETIKKIGDVATNQNAARIFDKPNIQRKLAAMFPGEENLSRFLDRMYGEQQAILTRREILQRSPTAEREALSEQYAAENLPTALRIAREALRGNITGTAEAAAPALARRSRIPPGQRDVLSMLLFEQDPQRQLQAFERAAGAGGASRRMGDVTTAGVAGGGAAAAGQNENSRRIARFLLGGS